MPPGSAFSVSVVVPNRNHAAYLPRSLGGILGQTRLPEEIIFLDDASDDDSLAVARATLPADAHIVELPTQRGALETMNEGVRRARGTYVALLAADDLVEPEFLERAAHWLDRHPDAPFCSGMVELRGPDGRYAGMRPILRPAHRAGFVAPEKVRRLLARGDNFFLGAATLYRRSALLELGPFDSSLGALADGMLQRRLAARHGFCFVPEILAQWWLHGENYSLREARAEALEGAIARARAVIEAEPPGLFPRNYGAVLERRMRFAAARLAVLSKDCIEGASTANRIVRASSIERAFTNTVSRAGSFGRTLLLTWLTVRQRPFSLTWLVSEHASRSRGVLRLRSGRA